VTRDVAVVGGGHNGLVAAAYLAKAGLDVLVLERRDVLGGAAVTEALWPGYRVSTAAYLISLLQEKVVRDLDLPRHGYEILPKDPPYFSPRLDGQHFFMWRDLAKTRDELARLSQNDAERYPAYEEMLDRVSDFVQPLLLEPPPSLARGDPEAVVDWARFMGRVQGLPRQTLSEVMRVFTASVADLLDDWFESDALKAALATDGVIGAAAGPRTPGTAYVLLHHQMGRVAGSRGLWGFARGGTGAVSQAIASAAREAGAEIRTGAVVERVLLQDSRAAGVVLADGEEIAARIVVSNADPKRTFLGLVGREHLSDDLGAEVDAWKIEGVSFKLNLALGELPSWKALPGTALGPQHRGTMHVAPSIDYIERAWDDAKYGRTSAEPMIEVGIPTAYDPSLAPEGKQIVSLFVQYAPYRLADGRSWETERQVFADRVIRTLGEYAPNLPGAIEHQLALAPPDLEDRFGLTGGHIFHGELSPGQLFFGRPLVGWSRYATPIEGLYLCGSGTHPGGGVMGASGHNAAGAVLKQLAAQGIASPA
jgi:phytoene dehydrogenase-like protein